MAKTEMIGAGSLAFCMALKEDLLATAAPAGSGVAFRCAFRYF
jgi:hypothetical protein